VFSFITALGKVFKVFYIAKYFVSRNSLYNEISKVRFMGFLYFGFQKLYMFKLSIKEWVLLYKKLGFTTLKTFFNFGITKIKF